MQGYQRRRDGRTSPDQSLHKPLINPGGKISPAPKKTSKVLLISAAVYLLGLGFLLLQYSAFFRQTETQLWIKVNPGGSESDSNEANAMVNYFTSARANLTSYKTTLLSHVAPEFNNKDILHLWTKVFGPIITCPPGRPVTKYGGLTRGPLKGDGSKLMCRLPRTLKTHHCVIYSLGSNGDYTFEWAMLRKTKCEIHTFDCAYKQGKSQHKRHQYHTWCVGNPSKGPDFKTWTEITTTLNHTKVDLLKMDIEGAEYAVISAFRPGDALPAEIAMEFHIAAYNDWPGTAAELSLSFLHMAELGYAVYAQEVNQYAPTCCCEFSFLRVTN